MRCRELTFAKRRIEIEEWILDGIILVAAVGIMIFCFSQGIEGNDFWWHVKVGEYVCKNHVVPVSDIFSWLRFEREIPWTAHEWLSDVIFYWILSLAGETGVFLFSFAAAIGMMACLWVQGKKYSQNNVMISGLYYCLLAVQTSVFFYGRPQIFSFFLVFLELKILYAFYEKDGGKSIWFLPLLSMLWSNLHGGSANLSYLLCGLFLFVGSFDFHFERIEGKKLSKESRRILFLVLLCTMGAIFINPIGYRVFTYPYANLSDKLSMSVISEWQAPDAKKIGHLVLFFLPIAVISMGLVVGTAKSRLIDWLIMLAFVFLFFRSTRFIVFWFIAAPFYAFQYFPCCHIQKIKGKMELCLSALLMVLLIAFAGYGLWKIGLTLQNGTAIAKVLDEQAVEVIKADAPKRIYNDYNVAETLIYHDVPVFFDARADLFSKPGILADGISMMMLQSVSGATDGATGSFDPEALIAKYDFDAFAILKTRPLYVYLHSHPERYVLVYEDGNLGYFRRLEKDLEE